MEQITAYLSETFEGAIVSRFIFPCCRYPKRMISGQARLIPLSFTPSTQDFEGQKLSEKIAQYGLVAVTVRISQHLERIACFVEAPQARLIR